ncbi:hypothetical protein Q426_07025 [Streptococcus equi subsp. zooepidemicus CY]|nr:hypothetical protein Q426_07025 [Streptococcus equi subsp. zooepidemicus CY]
MVKALTDLTVSIVKLKACADKRHKQNKEQE